MTEPPHQHSWQGCSASMADDLLTIENSCVRRVWRVDEQGQLWPISLIDRRTGRNWFARPARQPSPLPQTPLPSEPRQVSIEFAQGAALPVEAASLRVTLTATGESAELVYRFCVYPDSAAITCSLQALTPANGGKPQASDAQDDDSPTGVELADQRRQSDGLTPLDSLEYIEPASMHLKLTQVVMRDQTDVHNELVFENEWLLHPDERSLSLRGNLFDLHDPLSGEGLVLLKLAPLPEVRPCPCEADLRTWGISAAFYDHSGRKYTRDHSQYPLSHRLVLYGHGTGGDHRPGYRWVTLPYSGGREGRTAAIHAFQRLLRVPHESRTGLMLSNTWGDRSRDACIRSDFLSAEVEAAARLGVDVVQIDDGWQKGVTANSARQKPDQPGAWEDFWTANPDFWEPDEERLPGGLTPLVRQATENGLRFGLWFAPDSADDFFNWRRDADVVLRLHRTYDVEFVKIDGVKVRTRPGEENLRKFFHAVLEESGGKVTFDLDVTAEIRPGWFGMPEVGPLFVENRYSDFRRYWPHHTLRNFWKLSRWIEPRRLRMELLNNHRNRDRYREDPLAPETYRADYLLAAVLMGSPLVWCEVQNLPEEYFRHAAQLAEVWKHQRPALLQSTVYPIGECPDGTSWTGFAAATESGREAWLLLFRERNERPTFCSSVPMLGDGEWNVDLLAGEGELEVRDAVLSAAIPAAQRYLFARLTRA
ncbi:MAG: alpha-galactosidase [Phycisphaerae bacterium]